MAHRRAININVTIFTISDFTKAEPVSNSSYAWNTYLLTNTTKILIIVITSTGKITK